MEEERRLCYVGMTRAERWLFLTGAWQRRLYGSEQQQVPSMFLQDIPSLLDQSLAATSYRQCRTPARTEAARRTAPCAAAAVGDGRYFAEGRIVQHQQFGRGVIQKCEGEGEALKLTIVFSDYGIKKIMPKYASMQVV